MEEETIIKHSDTELRVETPRVDVVVFSLDELNRQLKDWKDQRDVWTAQANEKISFYENLIVEAIALNLKTDAKKAEEIIIDEPIGEIAIKK